MINQSDPDWHLYIIDDCSTDDTEEIVKKYLKKNPRISWKKHEKNIGSVPTIIEGFSEIDADYISTLCSDDWLEPNFVADAKKAFAENPEIPFCALGWSPFMKSVENNQIFTYKAKTPLTDNFYGKIYLSPYVIFENFVNINFLVFNRQKLQKFLPNLTNLKIKQYLETFLITNLETKFGAGYFHSDSHGYWRRHFRQLTTSHFGSEQTYFENFTLPLFYCNENISENQSLIILATRFLYLVNIFCQHRNISYKATTKWLLSDLGKPFAENFGNLNFEFIEANNLEKSLLCLAVCVWSSFIFNWGNAIWENDINAAKQQLGNWIVEIQKQYNLRSIKEIYAEANKLYDGLFMPLIK